MRRSPIDPPKRQEVEAEVKRLLDMHLYKEGGHAIKKMRNENVTRMEIIYILRHGGRVPRKDQRNSDGTAWKYAFEGSTVDGRRLRVVVFVEDGRVEVVTAIDLERGIA